MWTIDQIHEYINQVLNKDQTGYFTHAEIDDALDHEQMVYFNECYARFAGKQRLHDDLVPFKETKFYNSANYTAVNDGGTGPDGVIVLPTNYLHLTSLGRHTTTLVAENSYSMTTTGTATLTPNTTMATGKMYKITVGFTSTPSVNFTLTYGTAEVIESGTDSVGAIYYFVPASDDQAFKYKTSVQGTITVEEVVFTAAATNVEVINEDQIYGRLDSSILSPSTTDPVGVIAGAGGIINGINISTKRKIQLFPNSGQYLRLTYLRRPASPVFSYTVADRVVTYDSSTSTQMEWNDQAIEEIIKRAIKALSVTVEDEVAAQFAQSEINEMKDNG